MAAKLTARAVERVLESRGVPGVPNHPYRVSGRAMFAQLVVDALAQARKRATWQGKTPPSDTHLGLDQVDALVRNANTFLNAFWHAQRTGEHHRRVPVIEGAVVSWRSGGEVSLDFDGIIISGNKSRMASIRREGAITPGRLTPEMVDAAYERLDDLVPRARRILEDATGRDFPLALEDNARGPWGYVCLLGEVDGRSVRLVLWSVNALAHRSDDDLLHQVGHVPHEIFEGGRRKARFLTRVPDIQDRLDAVVAQSGLPISITLAQDAERSSYKEERDDVWLVLDGYGPAGLPRRVDLRTVSSTDAAGDIAPLLARHLKDQRRLHERYGPTPGSGGIDWTVDAVTARMGVTRRDVERCLVDGSVRIREGVSIRVSGRRILGQVELSKDVLWRGDDLRATGVSVPVTVMTSIVGRPVHQVVEAEALVDAGTVTSARAGTLRKRPRLALRVKPTMLPITELPE